MKEEDYIQFGEEWKAEVKKMSKDMLIELLRAALIDKWNFQHPNERPLKK